MSEYLSWHVGMRVVCVDNSHGYSKRKFLWLFSRYVKAPTRLVEGDVYTLSYVGVGDIIATGQPGVGVLVNGEKYRQGRALYSASRFRPVQARKTDIRVFTALLHSTNEKVGV